MIWGPRAIHQARGGPIDRVLAAPGEVAPSRRPYRGRTTGGAYGAIIVNVNYEHTYRGNPGDAALPRGMTARFNAGIRVRPLIRDAALNNRRLWLKVWMTPRSKG